MRDGDDVCRRRVDDPRHPVHLSATVEPVVRAGLPQPGRTVNLSQGGLSLELDGVLDPGAPVRVTLRLHGRAALMVVGRVSWVDRAFTAGHGSAGVAFKEALAGDLVADLASEEIPTREQQSDSSLDEK
jgi:PilZ domain-containing protein